MVPTNIAFDWFQMPVLALVYVVDPLYLWFGIIGLSLLLFLAPWLPPKRMGAAKAEATVTFHPDHRAVTIRFDETLLDAGLRQDINLPYECRNGGCGQCKCTVLSRQCRPRPLPAQRAVGGGTCRRQGAAVLRHGAGRCRDRV